MLKFGLLFASDDNPLFTVIVYYNPAALDSAVLLVAAGPPYAGPPPPPLANTLGEPCTTAVHVLSPTLPMLIPSANTLGDPPTNGAVCTQQQTGQAHGLRCGVFLCPRPLIGIPLANTELKAPFLLGPEQCVLSLSPFLVTAGMPVFMDAKNRLDYNLNLLNWPFLTSCLMPPEI